MKRAKDWGSIRLAVVLPALLSGIQAIVDAARRLEVGVDFQLIEAIDDQDPLAMARFRPAVEPGDCQVVLWSAGPDRPATLKVLQAVTGASIEAVRAIEADLPAVVLDRVARWEAEAAVEQLRKVGADAQVLGPADFVRR